jgi:hypothetical protein
VEIERIKLGDKIRVISEPHGVNQFMTVSSMTINIDDPAQNSIHLGHSRSSLTDITNSDGIKGKVEQAIVETGVASGVTSIKPELKKLSDEITTQGENILGQVSQTYVSKDEASSTYASKNEVSDLLTIRSFTCDEFDVNPNVVLDMLIDIGLDGYTPVGVVGVHTANGGVPVVVFGLASSTQAKVTIENITANTISIKPKIDVLFLKNI